MKIAIVDDDIQWREKIKNVVYQMYNNEDVVVDIYENGMQYLENKTKYEISLVDIEMPELDGFETIAKARKYNEEGIFIILTTHTEMSRKGFLVNAYRYIDKEMLTEELTEALKSTEILLGRNEKVILNIIGEGVKEIVLKNIIYIETEKHNIIVHTKQGKKICSNTLNEVETLLEDKFFYRCHNAYIVNLDEIESVENTVVYMSNGENLDVSRRKKAEFRKVYLKRQYECASA